MTDPGRPTIMTEETIAKLEEGFLMGFTDREACLYANINPSTLYRFCGENKDFSERKELLKENVKMRAKQNIHKAIGEGDKTLSQWYTERRDPDFNPKQQIDHTTKGEAITETPAIREAAKLLNDLFKRGGIGSDGTLSGAVGPQAPDKDGERLPD